MKKYFLTMAMAGIVCGLGSSCNSKHNAEKTEAYKKEILQTEKEFEAMVAKEGMTAAFSHFVAPDGVVNTNDTNLVGPAAVRDYYAKGDLERNKLSWTADFVDVAASGDLGYTYGKFIYTVVDSAGNATEQRGIFHTVWKRQPNGLWRFVWD